MAVSVRFFECGSVFEDIFSERVPGAVCSDDKAFLAAVMPSYKGDVRGDFSLCLVPAGHEISFSGEKITYGMQHSADITLSSVGERECMLCFARQIGAIEPQEIPVPRSGLAPDVLLGIASACIIAKTVNNPNAPSIYF